MTIDTSGFLIVGDVYEWEGHEWAVTKTSIQGGGSHGLHDVYPDGWHVTGTRLVEGKLPSDGVEETFYQSGCFTDMRPNLRAHRRLTSDSASAKWVTQHRAYLCVLIDISTATIVNADVYSAPAYSLTVKKGYVYGQLIAFPGATYADARKNAITHLSSAPDLYRWLYRWIEDFGDAF